MSNPYADRNRDRKAARIVGVALGAMDAVTVDRLDHLDEMADLMANSDDVWGAALAVLGYSDASLATRQAVVDRITTRAETLRTLLEMDLELA